MFEYRKPDYHGGFYICFQLADASRNDFGPSIPFDRLDIHPENYVVHFSASGFTNLGEGFQMPDYNMEYASLQPSSDADNFDPSGIGVEWKPYQSTAALTLPDPYLLMTCLNKYAYNKRDIEAEMMAFQEARQALKWKKQPLPEANVAT